MSIALFAEPIECEYERGAARVVVPALLIGVEAVGLSTGGDVAFVVNAVGRIVKVPIERVMTKWRYDDDLKDWIDHSGPPEEIEEDQ